MAETKLILHRGAREVVLKDLEAVKAPPATKTWYPLSHSHVMRRVEQSLGEAGYTIDRARYALSRNNQRFFGVLNLKCPLADGVGLAVGVRNSTDRSLPIGFCAGNFVVCCDNLAFSSEVVIARKHTRFGDERFAEALAKAVRGLASYKNAEAERVKRMQGTPLREEQAESLILRGYERGLVSHRLLPSVIKEWREPSFADFKPRTLFSLFNAFTTAMGPRRKTDPQRYARATIQLHDLLCPQAAESATQLAV